VDQFARQKRQVAEFWIRVWCNRLHSLC
jgi:hypothetical protein